MVIQPMRVKKYQRRSLREAEKDLSAGAIVGVVCAGVLVCGLASWLVTFSVSVFFLLLKLFLA